MKNYTFQLDIGSVSTPVKGGGYVAVTPFFQDAGFRLIRENNNKYLRLESNGNLKFYDDDFTALRTLAVSQSQLDMRIYYDGDYWQFLLNTNGLYDDDEKIVELDFESNDEYAKLIANVQTEINILSVSPIVEVTVNNYIDVLFFSLTNISQSSAFYTLGSGQVIYARQQRRVRYPEYNTLVGTSGWTLITDYGDGTYLIARNWTYEFSSPSASDFNQLLDTYSVFDASLDYDINNELLIFDLADNTFKYQIFLSFAAPGTYYFIKKSYFGADVITYTRGRLLTDVIEYIVGEMDSSILFDNDSFTYFDDNDDLANLIVMSLSDSVLASGVEKSNPATVCNFTFEKLFNWLREKVKIYYYLEYLSGSYYFRIVHVSEISQTAGTGANDLTTYQSINWTEHKNKYKINNESKYYRKHRSGIYGLFDFYGFDIIIPDFEKSFPIIEFPDQDIFTDTSDIINFGDKYPGESTSQIQLLSCDIDEPRNRITSWTNYGYTTYTFNGYNYYLSIVRNDASQTDNLQSNAFTLSNTGDFIRVAITGTGGSAALRAASYWQIVNQATGTPVYQGALTVGTYNVTAANATYVIEVRTDDTEAEVGTMTMNFTLKVINTTVDAYVLRNTFGQITGEVYPNAELSNANLDYGHGKWEMPYNSVKINNVLETIPAVQMYKSKEVEYFAPVRNPNDIDESKLIATDQGNFEIDEIEIKFDKSFSIYKGRL